MGYKDIEEQKAYGRAHYIKYKEGYTTRQRVRRAKARALVNRYKLFKGCVDCGYKKNAYALQLDHVRGKKLGDIAKALSNGWPRERLKAEIRKCEVRCANCHAIVTQVRRSISSIPIQK